MAGACMHAGRRCCELLCRTSTSTSASTSTPECAFPVCATQAAAAGDADAKLLHAHSGPAFDTYVKSGLTALGDVTASAAAQALARAEVGSCLVQHAEAAAAAAAVAVHPTP